MSYYQQLRENLAEVNKAMVETKGTPEHFIWVQTRRWLVEEIRRLSVYETATA